MFLGGVGGKIVQVQSCGTGVNYLPANARDTRFDPWVRKIPWSRKWQPTSVFLPGKFHGQRSLGVYSSRCQEQSDTTVHASPEFTAPTLRFHFLYYYLGKWKGSHSVVPDSLLTLGLVVNQASLSMGFSRQEYWSGLPSPSPGDLPNPELNPGLPHCRQTLYHLSHQGSDYIGKSL